MEISKDKNLTQKTISGMVWKLGERLGAQIVTLLVSIVLARILLPEDYGVISVVTIIITILNVFVSNGLGTSLIQKKTSDQLDFSTVFYFGIIMSLLLYGLLFLIAKPIADFYENDQLTIIIRIMGLRLPLAAINSVQQAYVAKKMIFRKFFFATLIGTIISGVVGIVMAYKGYGVWSLVAQYLTNVTIDTLALFLLVRWKPSFLFSFTRLKRLFSFGWKLLISGLLETGYNELRSIIIGKKYSTTDLAYYEKGKNFPSLIALNVNSSISMVLFAAMSKLQDDVKKVKEATRKSIKICSYFMFPCMVGLACVAEPFVRVVLTDKWLPAVPYIQIMCFFYAFWPIHTANLEALKAIGRSDLFLILEILKKIIGLGVLFATMWFGVLWIALGMAFTTITSAIINAFPNRKLLNYSYREQFTDLLPNLLICIVMGIPVYMMNYLNINVYLLLFIQVSTGIIIFLFLSLISKNYSFNYIVNYVKKIIKRRKKGKNKIDNYLIKNYEIIKKYINIEDLSKYQIFFDDKKEFIVIGELYDNELLIRYISTDVKKDYVKVFETMTNEIFSKINIDVISFFLDDELKNAVERNGIKVESVLRKCDCILEDVDEKKRI